MTAISTKLPKMPRDPYHPDTISLFDPGYLTTIDYREEYIFTQAVQMIDVSDPLNPDLRARLAVDGGKGVQVVGDTIYCASDGFQILRVGERLPLRVYLPLALRLE